MSDEEIRSLTARLERIEHFCFDDTPERRSLETVSRNMDAFIASARAVARVLKWLFYLGGTLAASAIVAVQFFDLWN